MPVPLRICSFNVENLFSRAKLLNFEDNHDGDTLLAEVGKLRRELSRTEYDKPRILELYQALKEYLEIAEFRGKLFNRARTEIIPDGAKDWNGSINFKRDKFNDAARKNTARVIRETNSDICCLIEVESRPILKQFCSDRLPRAAKFAPYSQHMLIDGNDDRGIDVALASRLPIGSLWSHVYDRDSKGEIFSRDCLEVELQHPAGFKVWVLVNHFKSKGYGTQKDSDAKRLRQSERLVELLADYDLKNDMVVVAGDLNDTPDSNPLAPLLGVPNLYDVLKCKFPDPADRWTYHYKKNEQIDYLLVSKPLLDAMKDAGVERRGIFGIEKYTNNAVKPFNTVTRYSESASDHGAVWAEFQL
jgi:endonuclease/exonuclease/phosphatase family metal-dependent hydrolase